MDNVKAKITVLLTGCGAPGAPGIIACLRRAEEREIRIVGVDMNGNAGARSLVDAFHAVPAAGDAAYIDAVLDICAAEKTDVVLPIVTRELAKYADAAARFEERGIKVSVMNSETLEIVNNKARLLEKLRGLGLPTPWFRAVNSVSELEQACREAGFPRRAVCVKGAVGNGSRGVRLLDAGKSRFELFFDSKPNSMYISYDELIRTLSEKPDMPEMLVMELLPGTEYSVDILADRGKTLYSVSRRALSVVTSNMMSLTIDDNQQVLDLCRTVAEKLKMDGNFGFDLLYNKNETQPYIIECNPRLTAGVVSCAAAGVNLPYLGIKRLLGEPLPDCTVKCGTRMSRHYVEDFFDAEGKQISW